MTVINFPGMSHRTFEQIHHRESASIELDGMDLQDWEGCIADLNLALVEVAVARDKLAELSRQMDLEESRAILEVTGANAEQRKATITLALNAEGAAYAMLAEQSRAIRLKQADAERRAEIARQQCRLLREAVALQTAAASI